jgi:membrane protein insertase Oxa1/YidC/SpoIIIJ
MIEWKRVPWPLWAYSVAVLLAAILIEVKVHGPVPAKVLFAAVMLAWLYFLLKGVRWVWIVTIGIYVLVLVPDLISGSLTWSGVALSLIGLMLLLLPMTRRYFSTRAAAVGT